MCVTQALGAAFPRLNNKTDPVKKNLAALWEILEGRATYGKLEEGVCTALEQLEGAQKGFVVEKLETRRVRDWYLEQFPHLRELVLGGPMFVKRCPKSVRDISLCAEVEYDFFDQAECLETLHCDGFVPPNIPSSVRDLTFSSIPTNVSLRHISGELRSLTIYRSGPRSLGFLPATLRDLRVDFPIDYNFLPDLEVLKVYTKEGTILVPPTLRTLVCACPIDDKTLMEATRLESLMAHGTGLKRCPTSVTTLGIIDVDLADWTFHEGLTELHISGRVYVPPLPLSLRSLVVYQGVLPPLGDITELTLTQVNLGRRALPRTLTKLTLDGCIYDPEILNESSVEVLKVVAQSAPVFVPPSVRVFEASHSVFTSSSIAAFSILEDLKLTDMRSVVCNTPATVKSLCVLNCERPSVTIPQNLLSLEVYVSEKVIIDEIMVSLPLDDLIYHRTRTMQTPFLTIERIKRIRSLKRLVLHLAF